MNILIKISGDLVENEEAIEFIRTLSSRKYYNVVVIAEPNILKPKVLRPSLRMASGFIKQEFLAWRPPRF